jgi:malonyl CoA-acyl carrier protein transacylase
VITGGVDTHQQPFSYLFFSKTQALSPTGRLRAFDAAADGVVISEGVVMLVLKRLADAERDGDRIYAVIQGVAGSSDGRAKGLTAPRREGQALALRRAYQRTGISPATVGLFEAHGTGTVVGDRSEAISLSTVLAEANAGRAAHAIGSVKSMIGHTKSTAGVAGLVKAALALHERVLPPTLGVTEPNPKARFGEGPLYVNSETRPWIHTADHPRRAGVSAFGFGGTNFHAVLEEYRGDIVRRRYVSASRPSELLLWAGKRTGIVEALSSLKAALDQGARPELHDLAYTLAAGYRRRQPGERTLAIVASSLADCQEKIEAALGALDRQESFADARGIYFSESPAASGSRIAFLFPGQGSQYPNMLRDLAVYFDSVRESFERADAILPGSLPQRLTQYVFPRPAFGEAEHQEQQRELTRTNVAQPALGVVEKALSTLLRRCGVRPDAAAGHSYGEFAALAASGALDEESLLRLSEQRGRCILAAGADSGTMAAVQASPEQLAAAISGAADVWIANFNAPEQTVLAGTTTGIDDAIARCAAAGLHAQRIPVSCAFHSPLIASAAEQFADVLQQTPFVPPAIQVFSNTTGAPYPTEVEALRGLLREHLLQPVRFVEQVERMYAAGCRIFVEVGPKAVLTGLTRKILKDRPHLAVPTDHPGRHGLLQFHHALGQLASEGLPIDLEPLFENRCVRLLDLDRLAEQTSPRRSSSTTWMVAGGASHPIGQQRERLPPIELPQLVDQARGDVPAPAPNVHATAAGRNAIRPGAHTQISEVVRQHQQLMSQLLMGERELMARYLQTWSRLSGKKRTAVLPASLAPDNAERIERSAGATRIRRRYVETPVPTIALVSLTLSRPVIITDDGGGAAEALAARVRERGGRPVLLRLGSSAQRTDPDVYATASDSADELLAVIQRIRTDVGPIGGLMHLRPLRYRRGLAPCSDVPRAAFEQWQDAISADIKGLFILIRAAAADLKTGDEGTVNRILVATTSSPIESSRPSDYPLTWDGALAHDAGSGLLRAVAAEWPAVGCKAVTFDVATPTDTLVDSILSELTACDGDVEVAYELGRRLVMRTEPAPLSSASPIVPLTRDSVVLVTGGLRGITAEAAAYLATHYAPTLVIAGRSPCPAEEPAWLNGVEGASAIKALLIDQAKDQRGDVSVRRIQTACAEILRQREMRRHLASLQRSGAHIRYETVDVRDPLAVGELVERIYGTYGRLDGIIHGAGVVEDRRIEDKALDSFDRVFDTKTNGAWALATAVRSRHLKFFVLYSSGVATYGNPGQADYAAANATLDAIARRLDRRWSTRVVAMEWGPWKTGMVSPELQRRFAERGIALIDVQAGCTALDNELRFGHKGESLVIIAGGERGAVSDPRLQPVSGVRRDLHTLPFLIHADVRATRERVEVHRTLDLARDRFLIDHVLDGRPVLPMMAALELMAESAQAGWPHLHVTAVRDLRVLKGVLLPNPRLPLDITGSVTAPVRPHQPVIVSMEIRSPETNRLHYCATVELTDRFPPRPATPARLDLPAFSQPLEEVVREWLFHGPLLQGIREVTGIGDGHITANITPSSPAACIVGVDPSAEWILDPVGLDCVGQAALLLARARYDLTILPTSVKRVSRFCPTANELRTIVALRRMNETLFVVHAWLCASDGSVINTLEQVELTGTAALNRLVGHHAAHN